MQGSMPLSGLLLCSVTSRRRDVGIPKDLGQHPGGNIPAEVTLEQSAEWSGTN